MRENRRITTREIADSLFVSKGTVDTILHEHSHYSKVCAQWVPKHLTEDQKCLRMGVCFQHLLRYRTKGNNFLSRIVACDETWCYFFGPATKQMSMEWRHSGSPRPKKSRSSIRAGKVMPTCFFDENCPLMLEWLETGGTVNANRFCHTLRKLKTAIKNCSRGLLSKGVILFQDNARRHVAKFAKI